MLIENEYADDVSVPFKEPPRYTSTFVTPTLSVADTDTVTVSRTVAPILGEVIETTGGTVSACVAVIVKLTALELGDVLPAASVDFAVAE